MAFAAPLEAKSIRFRARSFAAFTLTPKAPLAAYVDRALADNKPASRPGQLTMLCVVLIRSLASRSPAVLARIASNRAEPSPPRMEQHPPRRVIEGDLLQSME